MLRTCAAEALRPPVFPRSESRNRSGLALPRFLGVTGSEFSLRLEIPLEVGVQSGSAGGGIP